MLTETETPGSDDWWLMKLLEKLGGGFERMHKLQLYRDGDALMPDSAGEGTRESYMRFMRRSRMHVAETIRDGKTSRQRVVGFRTAAVDDDEGDRDAWKVWRANKMETQSRTLFNDTADFGTAYLIVSGPDEGAGELTEPIITTRNDWTTTTIQNRLRPWLSDAGVTTWFDPILQTENVMLFRPGYIRVASKPTDKPTIPTDGNAWTPDLDWTWEGGPQQLGFTTDCAIIANRTPDGFGVYEKHLDHIDRINEITLQSLTTIIMQTFRQKGISGNLPEHYPEGHPQAGQKVDYDEIFKAGPSALWLLPMDAKFFESAVTDPRPIIEARRDELKNLFAFTGTPQYVLGTDSANQSATGASLMREATLFSVESFNDIASAALGQALSLAFQAKRDATRADAAQIETIWAAIARSSIEEKGTASRDAKQGGATQRWIDTNIFEMTPAEQQQAVTDRREDSFNDNAQGILATTRSSSASSTPAPTPATAPLPASEPLPEPVIGG